MITALRLHLEGYKVLTATSAHQGLDTIVPHRVAVVIADYQIQLRNTVEDALSIYKNHQQKRLVQQGSGAQPHLDPADTTALQQSGQFFNSTTGSHDIVNQGNVMQPGNILTSKSECTDDVTSPCPAGQRRLGWVVSDPPDQIGNQRPIELSSQRPCQFQRLIETSLL